MIAGFFRDMIELAHLSIEADSLVSQKKVELQVYREQMQFFEVLYLWN